MTETNLENKVEEVKEVVEEKESIKTIHYYDIGKVKDRITELINSIQREGKDKLLEFLNNSDYFMCPASIDTKYHNSTLGGLARHSLFVYRLLADKVTYINMDINPDTIILTSLLHDLCKVNFYKQEVKWKKDSNNAWQQELGYVVNDQLPLGHGEKSLFVTQRCINLTDEEACMIRWHMSMSETGAHFKYPTGYALDGSVKMYPAVVLLQSADFESQILE